jgi:hypothetical protein
MSVSTRGLRLVSWFRRRIRRLPATPEIRGELSDPARPIRPVEERRRNMTDRRRLPGKFVWFDLRTAEPKKAQAFYGEVIGWKTVPWQAGPVTYEMIFTGDTPDTMIGGYSASPAGGSSHWVSYVSVATWTPPPAPRRPPAGACCKRRSTRPAPGAWPWSPTRRGRSCT